MSLKLETTDEFIDAIGFLVAKENIRGHKNETYQPYISPQPLFKLGQIASTYTSGRPQILFEGETVESLKTYPYLSSYTPTANDWVLLVKVGTTYIILGKII